jgi:pimeloyl-ACP methyl ester carboxylesterase
MATVQTGGAQLHYETFGAGRRLLFFNGTGSTIETMRPLLSVFADRFEVAIHDQRGLGRTTAAGPFTMQDYAADGAAVLDDLGWDTARVIGISFGGMVAQEFAVTFPERVERLALLCTSPGGEGGSSSPLPDLENFADPDRASALLTLLDTRFDEAWLAEHPSDRALLAGMRDREGGRGATIDDEQRRGMQEQVRARAGHDVWNRLARITCPTFVAGGRFDGIAPAVNSEAIASRVPKAELHLYEGGHLFFAQDAAALPEITAFLDEP